MRSLFYRKDECSKEYVLEEQLGRGSFATVKRAISRADRSQWAVKIIEKARLDKDDEEALKVEVEILQRVDHPNIVKLRQIFDCPKHFYMVMELMTGGELFDRIVEREKYNESDARVLVAKLAAAIEYCHDMGIVHRDLKPENLLFAGKEDDAEIKIADFGLAKLLNDTEFMATACGTPGYVAPEILNGAPYSDKVDLWSLGVITYILLCGFPPFYDENNAVLFSQIKAGSFDFPSPYWDDVSDDAKDLILKLLVVDPTHRLSAAQVQEHKWVAPAVTPKDGSAPPPMPEAPPADLSGAMKELRKYNARRRFKVHARTVQAATMFRKMGAMSLSDRLVKAADAAKVDTGAPAPSDAPAGGAGSAAPAGGAGGEALPST